MSDMKAKEKAGPIKELEEMRRRIEELEAADTEQRHTEEGLHKDLEESRQHQEEVSALLESSRAVLEYRRFQDAAQAIFDSCKRLLGATAGYVVLLSQDGAENEVLFLDSGGLSCAVDPNLPMPIRGLREEAYRTGKAVYNNDFTESQWVKYLPDGHVRLDNVLFAPLVIDGKVLGLLGLANKPGSFTENDARLASGFGEIAAVALHNSRTMELLSDSEERFRSVAQTAVDAIISTNGDGNILFWNQAAETMFGYSADEMLGKPLTLIIPERFINAHLSGLKRVISKGESKVIGKTLELAGLRKDGGEFPLELSLSAWETAGGTFFAGIARDITERKRAEEELNKHRNHLEDLVRGRTAQLERSVEKLKGEITERKRAEGELREWAYFAELNPDPVLRFDPDGKVIHANPAAYQVFGKDGLESKLIGENLPCMSGVDLGRFIREGRTSTDCDLKVGEKYYQFVCCGVPALGVGHLYGSDITQRKRMERRLAKLNRTFLNLGQDYLQNVQLLTEASGKLLGGDCALYNRLETGLLISVGQWQTPQDYDPADQPYGHICYDVIKKNEEGETYIVGNLPETHYYETDPNVARYGLKTYIGSPVYCDGQAVGSLCVVFVEDVTLDEEDVRTLEVLASAIGIEEERKRAEDALHRANEELRRHIELSEKAQEQLIRAEKMAAMGRLTAGVSHEILNPLNVITMRLHLMINDPRNHPEQVRHLRTLEEQASRIAKITGDFLHFSRQRVPERILLDLNDKVRRTLELLEYEFRKENIAVELKLAEGLPPVSADMDQIQQVMLNLLTNARDALPKGGQLLLSTEAVQANWQSMVELRVEDTGEGIPSEHMSNIFDPFFTTKPEGKGTGVGLAVCKGIIEAHGGTIWAESEEGQGTTFIIKLPAEPTAKIALA
jgi:PAS domain S-box-containing protein